MDRNPLRSRCSKVGGGDSFRRERIISLAALLQFFYRIPSMSLSATTQGFLKEVESSTGFKVLVEEQGSGLQVPLLAKVQVARRGMPFHRVVYHPSAGGMADYLICYHCAFILRLHSLPAAERFNLADNPVAEEECLKWTRAHEGSDPSDAERQTEVAGFLRTALMTMVRSVPVGIWVDQDLRARFPDLRAAQEQAIRRQVDTQAQVVSPRVREDVPAPALRANCAINAAFAKVWSVEFNEPGWCLPYVVDGSAAGGEALLGILDGFLATPSNDRRVIQAWADHLGFGHWLKWIQHSP